MAAADKPYEAIKVDRDDGITFITLNRPDKLNSLTIQHYQLLAKRLREAAARDDVIVTVVTGRGRYFSA